MIPKERGSMAETYQRQGALAALGLEARITKDPIAAGVLLSERTGFDQVNLRGDASQMSFLQSVRNALGYALPLEANTVSEGMSSRALWLGPNEWLVVVPLNESAGVAGALRGALGGQHAAVTEVGDARTIINLAGRNARDVVMKGCPLDLHPKSFGPMRCAQSRLAKVNVIIDQRDDQPSYDLYVTRSFARYLWQWLEDAGREYGVAIVRS
jgi:sarcosine oxidase subunit gamma